MASLAKELRRELERVVVKARRIAENGADKAIEQMAVHHYEPWPTMTPEERRLRNRLRAHGRQLGDRLDERMGTQEVKHLVQECAYEHWHRMLFARFLAESDLLIESSSGVAITLAECQELAREQVIDWLTLASSNAVKMLPQIFRAGDPVLEISLPLEVRQELERLLESLPREVFLADDSLGWVYQFWQTEQKDAVNKSGVKIGADELPTVTQLFTEDYMVLFLLHNTLGAWWTAKRRAEGKDNTLPGYEWTYLRLKDDGTPAAGSFEGWPRHAREITVLDPCMGSGHFLVFALPILVGFRMEEEGLSREDAVDAVLRDNLFGLEIDPRCSQIAAFNLALAAWKMVGYRPLPRPNLACSGLGIHASETDWMKLAGEDGLAREEMRRLYSLFKDAPTLGSLIDPLRLKATVYSAGTEHVLPLVEEALEQEQTNEETRELAVAAQGVVAAFQFLANRFTMVATNVPYLGRGKQDPDLAQYCAEFHSDAKTDLATCFVDRCLRFCHEGCSVVVVTPQNWLFLTSYKKLRDRLLKNVQWDFVARLGPRAFETISGEVVNVALLGLTHRAPSPEHTFAGWDVGDAKTPEEKAGRVQQDIPSACEQPRQRENPDSVITFADLGKNQPRLGHYATVYQGVSTTDMPRFVQFFWEHPRISCDWECFQRAPSHNGMSDFCGLLFWERGKGQLALIGTAQKGLQILGKRGLAIAVTRQLYRSFFFGSRFDGTLAAVIPAKDEYLPALAACIHSDEFPDLVREVDQALSVTESSFGKVRFDVARWQKVAAEKYPNGLPKPHSDNPTQWLFNGHSKGSDQPLHVAVARLLGFRWPHQTGSSFMDCPAIGPDGLESYADADGIVCLNSLKGEAPAADRLRSLLAAAFRGEWSPVKLADLLAQVGFGGKTLEVWLRDGFFEQHCSLFRQRPFIWHVWDGRLDGFHAFVNYHRLTAPGGGGRRTLEKLIYSYLGDWIDRQRADQKAGVEGADAGVAVALHLKGELEKILDGEPPYDIFVRWKPLHEQPIGWEPDINDGVRLNIRPLMTAKPLNARRKTSCILRVTPKIKWAKDRGKEPHRPKEDFPWFWQWDERTQDFEGGMKFDGNRWNDLHYSLDVKRAARERKKGGNL